MRATRRCKQFIIHLCLLAWLPVLARKSNDKSEEPKKTNSKSNTFAFKINLVVSPSSPSPPPSTVFIIIVALIVDGSVLVVSW